MANKFPYHTHVIVVETHPNLSPIEFPIYCPGPIDNIHNLLKSNGIKYYIIKLYQSIKMDAKIYSLEEVINILKPKPESLPLNMFRIIIYDQDSYKNFYYYVAVPFLQEKLFSLLQNHNISCFSVTKIDKPITDKVIWFDVEQLVEHIKSNHKSNNKETKKSMLKSTINTKDKTPVEKPFPKLMEYISTDFAKFYILAIGDNSMAAIEGFVVKSESPNRPLGYHSKDFRSSCFKDWEGSITLIQE